MKWKAYGRYGSVGFELIASMIVGYLFGHWLDGKVGGGGYITALFSAAGVYAGFRSLFKAANAMTADIEKEEKLDRGEMPWKVPMPDVDYDAADAASDAAEAKAEEAAHAATDESDDEASEASEADGKNDGKKPDESADSSEPSPKKDEP